MTRDLERRLAIVEQRLTPPRADPQVILIRGGLHRGDPMHATQNALVTPASRPSVDLRDHHLIARRKGFQKPAEFLPVNPSAGNLLTIDARTPRHLELVELRF